MRRQFRFMDSGGCVFVRVRNNIQGLRHLMNRFCCHSQLLILHSPGEGILCMVFSRSTGHLVAGCEEGCYVWKISETKTFKKHRLLYSLLLFVLYLLDYPCISMYLNVMYIMP